MRDIPEQERPASELFRLAAKAWVDADAAARMLEDTKTATLAQMISMRGDVPHNRAQSEVKASPEWRDYIGKMINARTAANHAKMRMEYYRMRFQEQQSSNYAARAEMNMSR